MGDERHADYLKWKAARTVSGVRNTDPDTSHLAAERIALSNLEARTYEAIKRAGAKGSTSRETAAVLGVDRDSVSPRHKALVAKGLIMPTDDRRQRQIVWRAVVQ